MPHNENMYKKLFDFDSAALVASWSAINDGVMGGVSSSQLRHDAAGYAVFEGLVSLEHNGGFASVRSPASDLGVAEASHFLLHVCGDGKQYKLNLRCDDAVDGVNYQAAFDAPAGLWHQVRLPLSACLATFRGRPVADAPALDPARLRQVGLVIANGQAGAFALALRSLSIE